MTVALTDVGRVKRCVRPVSQDQCEHPVITHGHVWSNKIQIWTSREEGMPKPPGEKFRFEAQAVVTKLRAIRQTTKRGTHQEPWFKADGHSIAYAGMSERPNEWAVVYGRVMKMPGLNENCRSGGCGGDDVALVIIAEPYHVRRVAKDGRPVVEADR